MKSIPAVPKVFSVSAGAYPSAVAVRQLQLAWLPASVHSPTPYCVLMHPGIHHHLGQWMKQSYIMYHSASKLQCWNYVPLKQICAHQWTNFPQLFLLICPLLTVLPSVSGRVVSSVGSLPSSSPSLSSPPPSSSSSSSLSSAWLESKVTAGGVLPRNWMARA